MNALIATRIRQARKEKGMTLTRLFELSGVQVATICRIENGLATGTIDSHARLAAALGLDLSDLYKDALGEGSQPTPVYVSQSPEPVNPNEFTQQLLLKTINNKKMIPSMISLAAGTQSSQQENTPGQDLVIFVLQGSLRIQLGEQHYDLNQNDSLYLTGGGKFQYINTTHQLIKALVIRTA